MLYTCSAPDAHGLRTTGAIVELYSHITKAYGFDGSRVLHLRHIYRILYISILGFQAISVNHRDLSRWRPVHFDSLHANRGICTPTYCIKLQNHRSQTVSHLEWKCVPQPRSLMHIICSASFNHVPGTTHTTVEISCDGFILIALK